MGSRKKTRANREFLANCTNSISPPLDFSLSSRFGQAANYPALDRRPLRGRPVVTGGGHFLQNRSNSRPSSLSATTDTVLSRGNNPSLHGIPLPLSWKNWIPHRSSIEEDNDFNKNLWGKGEKECVTRWNPSDRRWRKEKNFGNKKKNRRTSRREFPLNGVMRAFAEYGRRIKVWKRGVETIYTGVGGGGEGGRNDFKECFCKNLWDILSIS